MVGHRRRGDPQCPSDLTVAHTADHHREDERSEGRALLPVGG
jgi:hypothetical protein